jgi:hypothetical protein
MPGSVWIHVASYPYGDADNRLCGVVDRWHLLDANGRRVDKTFRVRRPAFPAVGWLHSLGGYTLPLYRLAQAYHRPEGAPVVVVEGEKCVHTVLAAEPGWSVTTCAGGALGWRDLHTQQLLALTADGSEVWLWPDADEAGARWLWTLRRELQRSTRLRILE